MIKNDPRLPKLKLLKFGRARVDWRFYLTEIASWYYNPGTRFPKLVWYDEIRENGYRSVRLVFFYVQWRIGYTEEEAEMLLRCKDGL